VLFVKMQFVTKIQFVKIQFFHPYINPSLFMTYVGDVKDVCFIVEVFPTMFPSF